MHFNINTCWIFKLYIYLKVVEGGYTCSESRMHPEVCPLLNYLYCIIWGVRTSITVLDAV